jgi:transposase InsO family protein
MRVLIRHLNTTPGRAYLFPGDCVHWDVAGPLPIARGGSRYAIMFADRATKKRFVYFMTTKAEAYDRLLQFEAGFGHPVKLYRTDNGGECTSNAIRAHYRENGSRLETTSPHSPFQNGFCERQWRTLFEGIRCVLISAHLPFSFWTRARDCCPHAALSVTPYERFHGFHPDVSDFHVFGSDTIAYDESPQFLWPLCL